MPDHEMHLWVAHDAKEPLRAFAVTHLDRGPSSWLWDWEMGPFDTDWDMCHSLANALHQVMRRESW